MATRKSAKPTSEDTAWMQHPLAHLIPDMSFYDTYVPRMIKGVQDMALLKYAQLAAKNTLLFGDTGPGKTSMVLAFCAYNHLPLITIQCNGGIDPNSFWGGYTPDAVTNGIRWQDSDVTNAVALSGEWGSVVYLDEPNFMPPKTAAGFQSLLDKRRQITILEQGNRLVRAAVNDDDGSKNMLLIASYNPDYAGTRPLNQAFKNRFKLKLHIDYDKDVEAKLVFMPVMLEIADKLRSSRKSGDLETPVSTNMLIEFEEFAADLNVDFAIDNFLAAFEAEEREAVRTVIEMHRADIDEQCEQMLDA